MGRWKFPLAMLAVAALLLWPETALNAGREAMRTWAASVAPALFPFLLLMPALTGAEAARAYEALLGRWMRPLLGLPGAAAPAVAVGMLAGSPAGAAAAVRTAKRTGMDARTLERLTGCVCGLGPGFLVSGIGASMLGSAADGRILLRSQLVAQTLMLLLSRRTAELQPTIADDASVEEEPVRAAVRATLSVCGYMAAFQMLAALLGRALRVPAAGMAALCLLDLPSGAKAVSALPMARGARLILLSAMTGFGGLCIAMQNYGQCRRAGVRLRAILAARAAAAAIMAAATAVQLSFPRPTAIFHGQILELSALCAGVFALPAWFFSAKTLFLNRRKNSRNSLQSGENIRKSTICSIESENSNQYVVDGKT